MLLHFFTRSIPNEYDNLYILKKMLSLQKEYMYASNL